MNEQSLPTWLQERDLARYAELTGLDFNSSLSPGKIWLDVGCRTGKALSEMLRKKKFIPVGINAHLIKNKSALPIR